MTQTQYIVERFDYGEPKGTVAGPTDKETAISKAEGLAEQAAEESRVDSHEFTETGNSTRCVGYTKHGITIWEVVEEYDVQ